MAKKKKTKQGGSRAGAGRKPIANPKRAFSVRLKVATTDKINRLADESGKSKAFVIEQAISKLRKIT